MKCGEQVSSFLPPSSPPPFLSPHLFLDLSDYREHKLTEENVGYQMLKKAGWTEGAGLGSKEEGIVAPINKWGLFTAVYFTTVITLYQSP